MRGRGAGATIGLLMKTFLSSPKKRAFAAVCRASYGVVVVEAANGNFCTALRATRDPDGAAMRRRATQKPRVSLANPRTCVWGRSMAGAASVVRGCERCHRQRGLQMCGLARPRCPCRLLKMLSKQFSVYFPCFCVGWSTPYIIPLITHGLPLEVRESTMTRRQQ